jgi:hypothetical protein
MEGVAGVQEAVRQNAGEVKENYFPLYIGENVSIFSASGARLPERP